MLPPGTAMPACRLFFLMFFTAAVIAGESNDRQLTHAAQGHVLTNTNVWSPDGAWIV